MPDQAEGYGGPERRRIPSKEEIAVVQEAELLSSSRYRRHKIGTVITSVVVTLLLAIPISLWIGSDIKDASRKNSLTNCETLSAGRPIGNARLFQGSEILPTADDAFNLFPRRFRDAELARINRDLAGLYKKGYLPRKSKAFPRKVTAFKDLLKFGVYLPPVDCKKLVIG